MRLFRPNKNQAFSDVDSDYSVGSPTAADAIASAVKAAERRHDEALAKALERQKAEAAEEVARAMAEAAQRVAAKDAVRGSFRCVSVYLFACPGAMRPFLLCRGAASSRR